MYNPYQQPNAGFNFQQTGYTGGGMNQPFSQPQTTGYYNMNQQPSMSNQQTGFYQPQGQTMYNQQPFGPQGFGNSNMNVQATQPTGLSYAQPMFQNSEPTGFQGAGVNPVGGVANSSNTDLKIPNMRLSFITASDQSKFEDLFRTAVPKGEQSISGDIARDILLRSGLQPITLAEIWTLSDTNKSGTLLFPEFALSLHLCNMALKGDSIPTRLPDKWLNEVKSFVDAINFSLPDQSGKILENTPFASLGKPVSDSFDSNWMTRMNSASNLQPQATGFPVNPSGPTAGLGSNFTPIQPQKTSGLIPVQKTGQLQPSVTGGQPLMQQKTGAGLPQPQQTGFQNMNNLSSSATGVQPQLPQQRTGMQQQPQFPGFQGGFNGLQQQRTGTQQMPIQLGGIQRQPTGFQPQATGFQSQATGMQPQTTGFQPQATGMQPQTTGFPPQTTGFQPQATGMQPQTTGFRPQTTGFQPQATGFQGQATGFQPQNTGLNPQVTGFQSQLTSQRTGGGILQPQSTGFLGSQPTGYLQSQPTGKPGQWGFVSAPTGGIPGLNAMESHFMPSSVSSSTNLQNAMGGNLKTNVTWAITKQEKQIYDGIFSAWDPTKKGFIDGDVAISIFGKSGLSRPDLESIWNLVDSKNSGRLNKDEFAVAMHLVYRRLNGFDIPYRLPPELVPPSARYIQDSMDTLKHSIKGAPASKQTRSNTGTKTEGERFKNNDYDVGYTSNARHRRRNIGPSDTNNSKGNYDNVNLKVEDLKKLIHEKRIMLSAIDSEDHDSQFSSSHMESKNLEEISSLKAKIRDIQSQLDRQAANNIGIDERKALLSKLNDLTQQIMPSLLSQINQINSEISLGKAEVAKLKLMKEDPHWKPSDDEANIVGTGPNGEVTQADRYKHRSKSLLRQRMAALTGKKAKDDSSDLDSRYSEEVSKIERNGSEQSQMISDIKSTIDDLNDSCFIFLQVKDREEVGSSKWDKGDDVSEEVKKFIEDLRSFSAGNVAKFQNNTSSQFSIQSKPSSNKADNFQPSPRPQGSEHPRNTLKQQHQTPEERSAYIKAQAEKRMNERLAKLGISRSKHTSQGSREKDVSREKEASVSSDLSHQASVSSLSLEDQKPSFVEEQEEGKESGGSGASLKNNDGVTKDTEKTKLSTKEPSDHEEGDDEDEAYEALMREKKELEVRESERKERKKKEKESRLAKLKQETEDLKRKEEAKEDESSDEEPVVSVPTYGPPQEGPRGEDSLNKNLHSNNNDRSSQFSPWSIKDDSAASQHATRDAAEQSSFIKSSSDVKTESTPSGPAPEPLRENTTKEPLNTTDDVAEGNNTQSSAPKHDISENNPFTFAKNNPFFKNQPTQGERSTNDNLNFEQPRGPAVDSNDWSDEDDPTSEDESTSRVGATHLANLLFGGMSQPVSRASEPNVEDERMRKEKESTEESKTIGEAHAASNAEVRNEAAPSEPSNIHQEQEISQSIQDNENFDNADVIPEDSKYTDTTSFDGPAQPESRTVQIPKDSESEDSDSNDSFSDAIEMPNASGEVDALGEAQIAQKSSLEGMHIVDNEIPLSPPSASAPSAPPPPPPPVPAASAPSAPPPPPPPMPFAAAPSAPAPPPPPPGLESSSEEKAPISPPAGDIGALLGQIRTGTSLKKVDDSQKHVADGAVVGRVL